MTFNDQVRSDSGRLSTRRGGGVRGPGMAVGGGGSLFVVIALFLISSYTGIDLTSIVGPALSPQTHGTGQTQTAGADLSHCTTGASANTHTECRMVVTADSLDIVWNEQLQRQGSKTHYEMPGFTLFQNSVSTACGHATSATGPFYCPGDNGVYLDMSFFKQMERDFGAKDAPLAQTYIVAHEWGHHIQNIMGTFRVYNAHETGDDGEGVRMELQADCYAGLWMHHASRTIDPESGVPFMKAPTQDQINHALATAAAIGDDRIQEKYQGRANPDTWTHGSSEQRQRWLWRGIEHGSIAACDTFSARTL